jgi:Transcriptional regulator of heat shock gene
MTVTDLTYREKEVLKFIIENFVKSALPVGSRNVSKQTELNLSPASIRNIMSDLEEMELISTPHTSAGRIPTDKGYRFYVDSLMKDEKLSEEEKKYLNTLFNDSENIGYDNTKVFSEISLILGKISHQLYNCNATVP